MSYRLESPFQARFHRNTMVVLSLVAALILCRTAEAQGCKGTVQSGCSHPGLACSPAAPGTTGAGHCTTGGLGGTGKFSCQCLGKPVSSSPIFDAGCSSHSAQGKFTCTIVEPNVTEHETGYPNVVFTPGDYVNIQADGCVQAGGGGPTWRRYVNPDFDIDPHRALFHGLVRIPETKETSSLVEIRTVTNRYLHVVEDGVTPLADVYLRLGYEDTDYSDNGYYSHDDGPNGQCAANPATYGGPAFAVITIYRGVAPEQLTSLYDFDVVANCEFGQVHSGPVPPCTDDAVDSNGLLRNPVWSWQLNHPGAIPDTSSCHNFSTQGGPDFALGLSSWIPGPFVTALSGIGYEGIAGNQVDAGGALLSLVPGLVPLKAPGFGDCTDQADASTVDLPTDLDRLVCETGEIIGGLQSFTGHVDWFPVTVEGSIGFGDHNADGDYDLGFNAVANNPLSVNNRRGLHVEFNSDELSNNSNRQNGSDW